MDNSWRHPPGARPPPSDLEPEADAALIARTVDTAVADLPVEAIVTQVGQTKISL